MSDSTAIFWPVVAQALLTVAIYILVSVRRVRAVRTGKANASDFRIPHIEPEPSATAARNLANQFELPVLFYVVCISLYVTGGATQAAVALAWAFVVARIVHALVHVTTNRLRHRRPLFISGVFINAAQWLMLAVHLTFPD